jgi:hypothetical protein
MITVSYTWHGTIRTAPLAVSRDDVYCTPDERRREKVSADAAHATPIGRKLLKLEQAEGISPYVVLCSDHLTVVVNQKHPNHVTVPTTTEPPFAGGE